MSRKDGQKLWLSKSVLPVADRGAYDPGSPVFQVEVRIESDGAPKLAWRASESDDYIIFTPSAVPLHVSKAVTGHEPDRSYSPVGPNFLLSPDGPTLEQLAVEKGVWLTPDN
jgi:hypothetical protein